MSTNPPTHSPARLARLDAFVQEDPSNVTLLIDAFECALALGEFAVAQRHLTSALALQSNDVFLRHRQAILWMAEKRYAQAETLLKELGTEDHSSVIPFNLAYLKFVQQDYRAAHDMLVPLLDKADAPASTLPLLLRCCHHLREFDEAGQLIDENRRKPSWNPAASGVASLLYLDSGDMAKARYWAEAALKADPNQVEALVTRGSIAVGEKDPATAKSLLGHALHQNPQDGRVWSAIAMASLLEMKPDQALQEFKTAVNYMPNHIGTWHGMAWCNLLRKDFPAAEQNFETALSLDRNFGESHGGLAVTLALQGKRQEAQASIARAIRLDPQGLSARYAEAILSGETADQESFRKLATRLLGSRKSLDGGSLLDQITRP